VKIGNKCESPSPTKKVASEDDNLRNLGIGLAQEGKKVLLVDCDPQASLTISLGNHQRTRCL
jgi:hypothetical protein